jgi:hypothetical protein
MLAVAMHQLARLLAELTAPKRPAVAFMVAPAVYGKLSPEELSHRLLLHARVALPDCIADASVGTEIAGNSRQAGQAGIANPAELVPRGGIEPPTRGFSVPCAADRRGRSAALPLSDRVARRSEEEVRGQNCGYPCFHPGRRARPGVGV